MTMTAPLAPRASAHRPSRRNAIVAAAVRVFAREGFADTTIQGVATEAGVAPTAVYYHFSGKEELFESARRLVLESVNAVVTTARADDEPGDRGALARVIRAVWDWLEANPYECRLLHHHLPYATRGAKALQEEEFERIHIERAFDYIGPSSKARGRRTAIPRRATETLAVRTLNHLTILIHPMRSQNAPLAAHSQRSLRDALIDTSSRIMSVW